jgi:hypothetical protein
MPAPSVKAGSSHSTLQSRWRQARTVRRRSSPPVSDGPPAQRGCDDQGRAAAAHRPMTHEQLARFLRVAMARLPWAEATLFLALADAGLATWRASLACPHPHPEPQVFHDGAISLPPGSTNGIRVNFLMTSVKVNDQSYCSKGPTRVPGEFGRSLAGLFTARTASSSCDCGSHPLGSRLRRPAAGSAIGSIASGPASPFTGHEHARPSHAA